MEHKNKMIEVEADSSSEEIGNAINWHTDTPKYYQLTHRNTINWHTEIPSTDTPKYHKLTHRNTIYWHTDTP